MSFSDLRRNQTPDFRINGSRIQDKILNVKKKCYRLRNYARYPINPDNIDIFQISCLESNIVYAIPMRKIENNLISSFFEIHELMKSWIYFNKSMLSRFECFKFDLNNDADIKKYIKFCEIAFQIPKISDQTFYSKIIDDNQQLFLLEKEKLKLKKK